MAIEPAVTFMTVLQHLDVCAVLRRFPSGAQLRTGTPHGFSAGVEIVPRRRIESPEGRRRPSKQENRAGGSDRPVSDYGLRVAAGHECAPWAPFVPPPSMAPTADLLLDSHCVTAA